MASVEHVEKALERLMPVALSMRATRAIEESIDTLAADHPAEAAPLADTPPPTGAGGRRGSWIRSGFGAAAAVTAGGLAALWFWPDRLDQWSVAEAPDQAAAENMKLIREVSRVESAVDEGTLADDAGGIHRVLRYRVVGESYVRDGSTGSVVRVVEPREEIVFLPVTAF